MAFHCVVVGGGMAGLTAAVALAKRGASVVLLEKARDAGGRATTQQVQGFRMNLGPHALYVNGIAHGTLAAWGIAPAGRKNSVKDRAYLILGGARHPFPHNAVALMMTSALTFTERVQAAKLMARLSGESATESASGSMRAWIDAHVPTGSARLFAEAMTRVSTYAADLDLLDAPSALRQIRLALDGGVLYLDEGWQSMVNALSGLAARSGVEIVHGRIAARVSSGAVQTNDGGRLQADAIVLAVSPKEASDLTGLPTPAVTPVRAACLDLGLSALPEHAAKFALGMDTPYYLSVHSATARGLAPEGGAMVHVAKYLGRNVPPPDREELENFAEIAMRGWKEHVTASRFMPNLVVTHAIPQPGGRPDPSALEIPGVFLAGDWVGREGMLVDAAVASGLRAADLACECRTTATTAA